MDVNTRIANFYNGNPDKQKYIAGVTNSGKVLLKKDKKDPNEKGVYVSLDELENGTFNWSQLTGETIALPKVEEPVPTINPAPVDNTISMNTVNPQPMEEVKKEEPVQKEPIQMPMAAPTEPVVAPQATAEVIPMPVQQPTPMPETIAPVAVPETNNGMINPDVKPANNTSLADVKTLFELSKTDPNSANTLNQILKTFAANENGEVDINKAQQVVQNNGIELSVKAIKNQKGLPTELYKYKADGTLISDDDNLPFTGNDDVIDRTFNNALIYANIPEENLMTVKEMYKKMVNDKLQERDNTPVQTAKKLELTNATEEKAGFADIFILVLIVAVYAFIIVNLILKIK